MSNQNTDTAKKGMTNQAKKYQLVLFPFNNGATNVYYVLTMNFIAYYANGVLGLAMMFATTMVTVMRAMDAFTDPVIGTLIDKTQSKFGKFRPYMVLGNSIMAVGSILLYFGTRVVSADMMWLRYVLYVLFYAFYVVGYTMQTSCTRSGQTCLTNDPKQRPLFTVFNTVASMIGMGSIQFLAPILAKTVGDYNTGAFFDVLIPIAIVVSAVLTLLAVIGIWEKDRPEFYGVGGKAEKVKLSQYAAVLKENKELVRLMVAGAGCKLAFAIATSTTVLCMLYGSMMNDYNGLFMPMFIFGYICSAPFFALTVKTSQKEGQKASLVKFTKLALVMYVGVLAMLLLWKQGNPAFNLSLRLGSINLYTILYLIFFGVGYGAYFATADMPIPMVADCSDYETYRSGNYIPGVVGSLFALVDKLVSSLGTTIVGIAVGCIGIKTLPGTETPYAAGMHGVVIVLFCIIPMLAWLATLWAMKGYSLTGARMKEIQAVNAVRKDAIAEGMSLEEAMEKWQTLEQVPEEYI